MDEGTKENQVYIYIYMVFNIVFGYCIDCTADGWGRFWCMQRCFPYNVRKHIYNLFQTGLQLRYLSYRWCRNSRQNLIDRRNNSNKANMNRDNTRRKFVNIICNGCPRSHWDQLTHIYVGELAPIGLSNGLLPGRLKTIARTNAEILAIGPLR